MTQRKTSSLKGLRFGDLYVLGRGETASGRLGWLCRCDCGSERAYLANNLRSGGAQSCGCRRRRYPDGAYAGRLARIWRAMWQRCSNPKADTYANYGARGIRVADVWKDYRAFESWAKASGYADPLSLDRIDNYAGYSPENCRWATTLEQSRNRRGNVWLDVGGERLCLVDAAELLGVSCSALRHRLKRGQPLAKIIAELEAGFPAPLSPIHVDGGGA